MIFGALGAAPLGDDGVFSAGPGAVTLGLPFLPSGGALYAPVVTPGAVTLGLPFLPSGGALYAPVVTPGEVSLGLPFLPSGGVLYAPVVSLPNGAAQSLSLPFLADTDILFSPFVARVEIPPVDRITLVAALPRAAHVEGLPRIRAPAASARIILLR
jgi:hypothetical protein